MKSICKQLMILALAFATGAASLAASAAPTTYQSSDRSSSTADALDQIDALPQSAMTAAAPKRVAIDPHAEVRDWLGLIHFFAPGLAVAASIGVAASIAGTFVQLRRESLIALAIPQFVAVGAAVGMRMGWPTLPPALLAVAGATVYFAAASYRGTGTRGVTLSIPALYIACLCVSFLIIAHGGQHVEELQNLFTGVDVAVTPAQATFAVPVLLIAALIVASLWRRWLLIAQAPATAELATVRVRRWNGGFLALLAVILLVGTNSQGTVLVLAMLFLPPAIVAPFARRIPTALLLAAGVSLICLAAAFAISVDYELPLSQSVGGVGFFLLGAGTLCKLVSKGWYNR